MAVRATESRTPKLYHYEQFCPKYLEDTFVNQRVHFSNPQNFNDPWDCNPWFDMTRVNDPAYRASCIEVLRQSPIPSLTADEQRHYEAMMQADPLWLKLLLQKAAAATRKVIAERYRIYCLTPHPDTLLMWSHYSDKHRGICLEFDAGQAVIGGAYQVIYNETFPALDVLRLGPTLDVFQILVNKSSAWHYEDEYRILARDDEADEVPPQFLPITNKDFLPLPPGALTAVIAGCRASFDEIKTLMEKHAPGLPVKRAVQALDRYSLSIQD